MRKLIALFAVTVVAASALAQGTVSFNNNSAFATVADRLVRNTLVSGGASLVGTDFVAQLYFGSQGTAPGSMNPAWGIVGGNPAVAAPSLFRVVTTGSPGTWSGGTRTLNGIASGTATLQVRVWNLAAFPTYDAAVTGAGVRGASAVFDYTIPAAGSPPAAFFMENMRGFTLVPEPSTIALGLLGVAGLLFIRRRK